MKKLTTLAAAALALAMTGAGALAETTLQLGTTVNEQDSWKPISFSVHFDSKERNA